MPPSAACPAAASLLLPLAIQNRFGATATAAASVSIHLCLPASPLSISISVSLSLSPSLSVSLLSDAGDKCQRILLPHNSCFLFASFRSFLLQRRQRQLWLAQWLTRGEGGAAEGEAAAACWLCSYLVPQHAAHTLRATEFIRLPKKLQTRAKVINSPPPHTPTRHRTHLR